MEFQISEAYFNLDLTKKRCVVRTQCREEKKEVSVQKKFPLLKKLRHGSERCSERSGVEKARQK
jgi:hypothetical protein